LQSRIDWNEFFALYRPLAVRIARGIVTDRDDEEEVVQEAMRSLYERATGGQMSFESTAHARNYFLRAVRNLAVSGVRRAGRLPRSESFELETVPARPGEQPEESLAQAEDQSELAGLRSSFEAALVGLSEPQRVALALRYQDGLSYRAMAERTGTSISTLQARVEAALEKIRSRLGKRSGGA